MAKKKKKMDGESTVGTRDIVIDCPTMIWKVLDSTNSRYALGYPHFIPITNKRGRWVATNARVAAVVHVDGDFDKTDDNYVVPPEVMPKKKTLNEVRLLDGSWSATGPSGASDSTVVANPTDEEIGRFPDVYPSVFPDSFDTFTDKDGNAQSRTHASLDAHLLLSLAEAINCKREGSKTVTIAIGGPEDSIAVAGDCGIGVIMPCHGYNTKEQAVAYKKNAVESARHQSPEVEPVVFAPQKEYEEFLRWKDDNSEVISLLAKAGSLISVVSEPIAVGFVADKLVEAIEDVVGDLPNFDEVLAAYPLKLKKTKKTKVTKEPVKATELAAAVDEDYMDYE